MNRAQLQAWMHTHQKELLAAGGLAVAGAAVYARHHASETASTSDDADGYTQSDPAAVAPGYSTGTGQRGKAGKSGGAGKRGKTGKTGRRGKVGPIKVLHPPKRSPRKHPHHHEHHVHHGHHHGHGHHHHKPKRPHASEDLLGGGRTHTVGQGGTVRDATAELYGTRTPSHAQVRKVAAANNIKVSRVAGGPTGHVAAGQKIHAPADARRARR